MLLLALINGKSSSLYHVMLLAYGWPNVQATTIDMGIHDRLFCLQFDQLQLLTNSSVFIHERKWQCIYWYTVATGYTKTEFKFRLSVYKSLALRLKEVLLDKTLSCTQSTIIEHSYLFTSYNMHRWHMILVLPRRSFYTITHIIGLLNFLWYL